MSMIATLTLEKDEELRLPELKTALARKLGIDPSTITACKLEKKSLDARKRQIKYHFRYEVFTGTEAPPSASAKIEWVPLPADRQGQRTPRVCVIGSGPAGLFAALRLIEGGIRPIIVERGPESVERRRDVAAITRDQVVNPDSNYCFGEGGAGTFSDGKLYTRSNKRGDISRILAIFNRHGADPAILSDAHPHLGTDKLPSIIRAMRETIVGCGGELRFGTTCVDIIVEDGVAKGVAVRGAGGAVETIACDAVIVASGHSARDMYRLLAERGAKLEAKTFAMGLRVEHPRELIDGIQYHGKTEGMPAAEYRLTTQAEGRGVYSFCMCPGGVIVPSATADDQIVLNGMSASGRNTRWSNAAIVVEIRPEDAEKMLENLPPSERAALPSLSPGDPLASLCLQEWIERETKRQGKGQRAPAQRLVDFLDGRDSSTLPESSYTPGLVPSRLDRWVPLFLASRLQAAFRDFNGKMRGFISPDAVVVAIESRTSTPVRVLRDPDSRECAGIRNLYPAGEGSGYSGGIVSSAMDGENVAEAIIANLRGSAG